MVKEGQIMAYVVDVFEPWLSGGVAWSTYDAEGLAELEGVSLHEWVALLEADTKEKGGTILYKGDPDARPDSVKQRITDYRRKREQEHDSSA